MSILNLHAFHPKFPFPSEESPAAMQHDSSNTASPLMPPCLLLLLLLLVPWTTTPTVTTTQAWQYLGKVWVMLSPLLLFSASYLAPLHQQDPLIQFHKL